MYAIIATGGKQYKVSPGMLVQVEKLAGEVGDEVRLEQVLAVRTDSDFQVGQPLVKGAVVKAKLTAQAKGPKVINFKFKRRKGYHRKVGHRQSLTRLQVTEIVLNGTH